MIDEPLRTGVSKSTFISKAVCEKIFKEKELKENYDTMFSDEYIRKKQSETATWFEACGNNEGQEW